MPFSLIRESCLGKRAACTPTLWLGILEKERHCLHCLSEEDNQVSEKSPYATLVTIVEMVAWIHEWQRLQTHVSTPSTLVSLGSRVASKISYGFQRVSGIFREKKMVACLTKCSSLIMLGQMDKTWTVAIRNLMDDEWGHFFFFFGG